METVSQEQQIRERAYAIWEGEGRPLNRAEAHWLQAEAEIVRTAARPNGALPLAKRAAAVRKPDSAGKPAAPAAPKRRTRAS